MAEEQKRKGESLCPVCGTSLDGGKEVQDLYDRTLVFCPKCGIKSPVLSAKQISAIVSLWAIAVGGPVVGVFLRINAEELDFLGISGIVRTCSVIAIVVGVICLVGAVVVHVLRKKNLRDAKLKWQSEHPAT
jgi:hypothetical protein